MYIKVTHAEVKRMFRVLHKLLDKYEDMGETNQYYADKASRIADIIQMLYDMGFYE